MQMTLLSPKGSRPTANRRIAPRLTTLRDLRIGLLSNGKLNADLFLERTAACFEQELGGHISELVHKPHASKPAAAEQLAALAESSDILITANGD